MSPSLPPVSVGIRVRLFGGPSLVRGGEEIPLSPYQRAALGIVYGQGSGGISRVRLTSLLWNENDHSRARHRLSQLLYATGRKRGAGEVFITSPDRVLPNSGKVSCDLEDLVAHLGAGRTAAALAMLDAGFLSLLPTPITEEFEDWRDARGVALRIQLREAAATAWSNADSSADWPRAREAAEALLALDPDSEAYLRCVMKARALCGFPEEAEAAYRSWVERRASSQQPITIEMLRRITAVNTLASASKPFENKTPDDPPLTGRRNEIEQFRQHVRRARRDSLELTVVTGEAGIGKSRLLHELCKLASIEGFTVLHAECSLLERPIPLNPLIDALSGSVAKQAVAAVEEPWHQILQSLMGEPPGYIHGSPHAPLAAPVQASRRLFDSILRLFQSMTADGPVILWLDDAHWADETTIGVIDFLHRRWRLGSMFVYLVARDQDLRGSALESLLAQRGGTYTAVSLPGLNDVDAQALVTEVVGVRTPTTTISYLAHLGAHNPLYLIELSHEYNQGRLAVPHDDNTNISLPVSITRILERRLGEVAPTHRRILDLLSVAGPQDLSRLQVLTGSDATQLASDLRALADLRLVQYGADAVGVAHELLRHSIYRSLPDGYRSFLHLQVAEGLRSAGVERMTGELAIHYHQGGNSRLALQFAVEAANQAERDGALPEAIRFLRIARQHAAEPQQKASLLAAEGKALVHGGQLHPAIGIFSVAEDEFRRLGDLAGAVECGTLRIGILSQLGVLEHHECAIRLDHILAEAKEIGRWDLYLHGVEMRMRVLERDGDIREIRRTLEATSQVPMGGDAEVDCMAHSIRALDLLFGEGEYGLNSAMASVQISRTTPLPALCDRTEYRLFVTLILAGRLNLPDVPFSISDCLDLAQRTDDHWIRVNCYNSVAAWMIDTGDLDKGRIYLDKAMEALGEDGEAELLAKILVNMGELAVTEGDFARGRDYHQRVLDLRSDGSTVEKTLGQAGVGICALKTGDLSTVRRIASDFAWNGDPYFECTLPTWFKLELSRVQGEIATGLTLLRHIARSIRRRLPLTWLKLALIELEYTARHDPDHAAKIASDGLRLSQELNLAIRRSQFAAWSSRLPT